MAGEQASVDPSQLFGPTNLTTTTVNSPPSFLMGPIEDYLKILQGMTFPGGQLAQYPYPDQRVAALQPLQALAQQVMGGAALQAAPQANTANSLALSTLQGNYLDPAKNPYLNATYDQAAKGVADQYRYATAPSTQAEFAKAGVFGGSANNQQRVLQQYGLGQTLNNLATDIYGGNYQQERTRQLQEQTQLPNLYNFTQGIGGTLNNIGNTDQQLMQTIMDTQYKNQYQRTQYPYQMLNMLGGGISQFNKGGTQDQTSPNPNYISPLAALLAIQNASSGGSALSLLGGQGVSGVPFATNSAFGQLF